MKKLGTLLATLLLCGMSFGQTIQYTSQVVMRNANVAGTTKSAHVAGSGSQFWTLVWNKNIADLQFPNVDGHQKIMDAVYHPPKYSTWVMTPAMFVASCQVQVDSSADGITWNSGDVVGTQNCLNSGSNQGNNIVANYVRINLTTFGGGVTGSVSVNLTGYNNNPAGGGGTPGGSPGDIQFNNAGAFGGETLVPLANGGLNADLSATGGAGKFLKQASAGAAITVVQPSFTDLTGTISQAQFPATTDLPAGGTLEWNGATSGTYSCVASTTGGNLVCSTSGGAQTLTYANGSITVGGGGNFSLIDTGGLTLTGSGTSSMVLATTISMRPGTANGQTWLYGSSSELLTLNTGSTTTDTAGNLLPAGAIIEAVVLRITTTITTSANYSIGDATTAARFCSSSSTLTSGSTQTCFNQMQGSVTTDAAGPIQTAAAKVRVTLNANPGAGAIRITVFYRQPTAPTS